MALQALDAVLLEGAQGRAVPGARVIPVYLRIENPKKIAPGDVPFEGFLYAQARLLKEAEREGYDGAQLEGGEWVVFSPSQIMPALGREARQDRREARHDRHKARRMRRRAARKAFLAKWGRIHKRPAVHAELRLHAWRLARLDRLRTLAVEKDKDDLVKRIDELKAKEMARHENRMNALKKPAPPKGDKPEGSEK